MHTYARHALGALLLLLAGTACSDPAGVVPVARVATVAVTPTSVTLGVGESADLTAVALDEGGVPLGGRSIAWSSEDAGVASVDGAGRVTAHGAGSTRVRAASEGRTGLATVTVVAATEPPPPPPPPVASVTLDADAVTLGEGATRQLVATPRGADGAPIAGRLAQWSSNAEDVATVSASGTVTAVRMGTATITVVVDGRIAQAMVSVFGTSPFDLLFELTSVGDGPVWPSIVRLDLRDPAAAASRVPTIWNTGDAAPSPDGSRLAFVCDNGGSAICVADLDGRDFAVLTGGALLADQPAWSPDGSRIAFRGWAQGGPPGPFNPSRIWVMNADGSGKVSLTTDAAGWQADPTWSPRQADGSYRIAYSQQSLQGSHVVAHVVSMRADGADARPVTAAGEQLDDEPAWSPDGATIAFVRTGGEASGDLWLAAAAGGAERPLMASDPAGAQRAPAWSPDGAQLAFASNHDLQPGFYTWQIFTVRADGTQLVRRTHDRAEKQRPAWMRRLP